MAVLADEEIGLITECLPELPADWSYYDKVFAWLQPEMQPEMLSYYKGVGHKLTDILDSRSVIRFDKQVTKKLKSYVEDLKKSHTSQREDASDFTYISPDSAEVEICIHEMKRMGEFTSEWLKDSSGLLSELRYILMKGGSPSEKLAKIDQELARFERRLKKRFHG